MIELKDYFEKIKSKEERVMLWVMGDDQKPLAMRTYVKEVFVYDDKLAGLGCSPDLNTEYMEYIAMDEVIKFSMVPDEMMKEFIEESIPPQQG